MTEDPLKFPGIQVYVLAPAAFRVVGVPSQTIEAVAVTEVICHAFNADVVANAKAP